MYYYYILKVRFKLTKGYAQKSTTQSAETETQTGIWKKERVYLLGSDSFGERMEILHENIDIFLLVSEGNEPLLVQSRWSDDSTID